MKVKVDDIEGDEEGIVDMVLDDNAIRQVKDIYSNMSIFNI